jgi:Arc/MetJ-type ribon-helix-helix transcriptional regulator
MPMQIALRIADDQIAGLDQLVDAGSFDNRTAAIRAAIDLLLADVRERAIAEAYRRGYTAFPQEDWAGEVGLALMSARLRADGDNVPL